jgi:diguanylate cyclase (GGDEF)-like protein
MRDSIRLLLQAQGHGDVRTAASGREALELLAMADAGIEVVLTDVHMPGLDGIELCRRIKADQRLRDVPVLILTGMADDGVLERAFAAGAHDFIPKPGNPPELLARLRSAVKLKRELDRRKARERDLVDVTDRLKRLNDELRRLAVLDELTQVPNRRFFNMLLRQEWARAAREVHPLALVLVDVDLFKNYNDRYGHPAGDACLARVAAGLQGVVRRPGDAVARFGGEEFVILLAHTAAPGAAIVAENLRAAVEEQNLEHAGSPFGRVTISLGVASAIPDRSTAPERLLAAADQSLYDAKAAGRNRAAMFQGALDVLPVELTPLPVEPTPLPAHRSA